MLFTTFAEFPSVCSALKSFVFDNPCPVGPRGNTGTGRKIVLGRATSPPHVVQVPRSTIHAGLDLPGQVAHGRRLFAMNTPDVVQNFDLNIAGYGFIFLP